MSDSRSSVLSPRARSALLWGAVGALTFLVLLQGYALLEAPLLSIAPAFGVALAVGVGAGIGAYVLEPRVAARAAERHRGG